MNFNLKMILKMNLRMNLKRVLLLLALICYSPVLQAQDAKETILFTNVKVFNGVDEQLLDADVLVEGNLIKQVGKNLRPNGATVIDGGGRTLMPGMVNMHEHLLPNQSFDYLLTSGYWDEVGAGGLVRAQDLFDMGFTTVRDAGGWALGIKRVIDRGELRPVFFGVVDHRAELVERELLLVAPDPFLRVDGRAGRTQFHDQPHDRAEHQCPGRRDGRVHGRYQPGRDRIGNRHRQLRQRDSLLE